MPRNRLTLLICLLALLMMTPVGAQLTKEDSISSRLYTLMEANNQKNLEIALDTANINLRVTQLPTPLENLEAPIKLVLFSDLHMCDWITLEQVETIVTTINALEPDCIFFTGDLFDANTTYSGSYEDLTPLLTKLQATYGKYAVLGNHDVTKNMTGIAKNILEKSGFTILTNTMATLEVANQKLTLAGVIDKDDKSYKTTIIDSLPKDTYNIFLNHRPDLIDTYDTTQIDLQLSGHSHGGQIVLDGTALGTTPYGEKYIDGLYTINDTTTLLVNRGIGYSRMPIRLNCPATIDLLYLTTAELD